MKISAKYIPCSCGGKAVREVTAANFSVRGVSTTVKDVPAFVCEKCEEIYYDGPSIVRLETEMEQKSVSL